VSHLIPNTVTAHSGKVGGGRKGIGKKAFEAFTHFATWTDVVWPDGERTEYRIISRLNSLDLQERTAEFVHEVAQFKATAVSG
jgi:hypothetical protein